MKWGFDPLWGSNPPEQKIMNKKYDIITFGSASRDAFLRAKEFSIGDFKKDHVEKEILLPFGLKVDINEIHFYSGGGGTNAAATFSSQGLKTAYCGTIGKDPEGEAVFKEIKEKKISTNFVLKSDKKPTNFSVIFSTPKERTILAYKGASQALTVQQIPWQKIKNSKWFYLAPLGSGLFGVFNQLVSFAKSNQIDIMLNLDSFQLKLNSKVLYPLLQKVNILLLNQEEGQMLIKDSSLVGEKLVREIRKIFQGILIITNGSKKVLVSDEKFLYSALPLKLKTKIVDTTGAGDAFGAGFLSGYIKSGGDIVYSIQLAIANSAFCIRKLGAKEGILRKGQKFKKVKVIKQQW